MHCWHPCAHATISLLPHGLTQHPPGGTCTWHSRVVVYHAPAKAVAKRVELALISARAAYDTWPWQKTCSSPTPGQNSFKAGTYFLTLHVTLQQKSHWQRRTAIGASAERHRDPTTTSPPCLVYLIYDLCNSKSSKFCSRLHLPHTVPA